MVRENREGSLRSFDFKGIKDKIPELNLVDCRIDTFSFEKPIDSSNMSPKYWIQILEVIEKYYHKVDGFVILSGTDTMSYTASAISFMIENLCKPIIFTGSQLPIGDLRTDAKENLITSIQIAAAQLNGKPVIREVGLYFEYKLYRANRTRKISSEQFDAFQSPNFSPLCESGVHLSFNFDALIQPDCSQALFLRKDLDQNIVILKLFPGIKEEVVTHILNIPGLQGVVLETFGSGNAPTEPWFINILRSAISKGIPVINVTQCISGSVIMGYYETSEQLKKIGVVNGKDITTESAIAKMKYLLGLKLNPQEFKRFFEISIRGEMTD